MHKKTIIHFIYNLGLGGAEVMLVSLLNELSEYRNIIVTLQPLNAFEDKIACEELICLHMKSPLKLLQAMYKFRQILKAQQADLVHTHLYWPTIIGRFATPSSIPLVTTLHTSIDASLDYKKSYIRALDKLSVKFRRSYLLAVSHSTLHAWKSFIKIKPVNDEVLHTFIEETAVIPKSNYKISNVCRLVSVGALRLQKNHHVFFEGAEAKHGANMELDIVGTGPLLSHLTSLQKTGGMKVNLVGQVHDIPSRLHTYDVFISGSSVEGFSLAVLEAMAAGLPLILSDIPSHREQCADAALYFSLNNANEWLEKVSILASNQSLRESLGRKARKRLLENYTFRQHIHKLRDVYKTALKAV